MMFVCIQVQQNLGYCPQFDALIDQMTGRETLYMYARLRGIQESQIRDIVEKVIDVMMLRKHAEKQTGFYRYADMLSLSRFYRYADMLSLGRLYRYADVLSLGRSYRYADVLSLGRSYRYGDVLSLGRSYRYADVLSLGRFYRYADVLSLGRSYRYADVLSLGRSYSLISLKMLVYLESEVVIKVTDGYVQFAQCFCIFPQF